MGVRTKDGQPPFWLDFGAIAFPLLLILTFVAPLNQGLYFGGDLFPFQMVAAVLFLLVAFDRMLKRQQAGLFRHPLDWAAMAFAAGYVISAFVHPVVPYDARVAALRSLLFLGWYWSVASLVQGRGRLLWYGRVLYATTIVAAIVGCLAAAGKFPFPGAVEGQRILGTLQYANSFGALLLCAFIVGMALQEDAFAHSNGLALGLYGAGNTLLVVTLLGTTSRGAWIVFPVAVALWWVGLHTAQRARAAILALWPIGVGLLLSRPVLDGFWGHRGVHGLTILGIGMVIGAAASVGFRYAEAAWVRQRMTPEMRRVLQGVGALYGIGVLAFLLYSAAGAAASVAGGGILASNVATRVSSIGLQTSDLVAREVMWRDALRLVARHPILGYGGGGWEALYHTVQSGLYWSAQAHESILQAWVDGGLLAALGLIAVGALTLGWAWRLRAADRVGGLLWGLAVAGTGLFLHSLADFDLSLPALALIVWGAAGILRGQITDAPANRTPGKRQAKRWAAGIAGLVPLGAIAVLVFFPSARLEAATTVGGAGALAMDKHQYGVAYQDYTHAVALAPFDATYRVDLAQLLGLAYDVNQSPATLHEAAGDALAAAQFDPGSLPVQTAAMNVLQNSENWYGLGKAAALLPKRFPLDGNAYDFAAVALVAAAKGEVQVGSFSEAHIDIEAALGLPRVASNAVAYQMTPLGRRTSPKPQLSAQGMEALGEADVLLGNDATAAGVLGPMVGTSGQGAEAAVWYAAAESRLGNVAAAEKVLTPLLSQSQWQQEWNLAYQLSGFAKEVRA